MGGQSPYRGGGRRGGRPFRGSSRGTSFNRGGRGRGRGAPRHSLPDGAASASSSQPKPSANAAEMSTEGSEEKAEVSETTQITPVLKQGNPIPNKQPPPQAARCELCQVGCNSLAILEMHKNGKKHKKNLQKAGKAVPETDSISQVTSHPETVQEGKVEQIPQQETLTTEFVDIGSNVGALQQNDNTEVPVPVLPVAEQSNVPEAAASGSSDQRHGTKRKIRGGGRGGKRVKPVETAKPSKPPKVVIPLICDLCNIRCDTQEVFDKHLAGKKHISKLKRFEGHQAMYGPSGLQALYPPNPIAQTMLAPPQGPPQQYVYDAQVSLPLPEPYVPPQPHYSAPATVFQPNIGHH